MVNNTSRQPKTLAELVQEALRILEEGEVEVTRDGQANTSCLPQS
jgi:hypothetical protein